MRTTILILTIIGYVILLTLQLGKGGLLYCQSGLGAFYIIQGAGCGCDCDRAESKRLRSEGEKEILNVLFFAAVPIALGFQLHWEALELSMPLTVLDAANLGCLED